MYEAQHVHHPHLLQPRHQMVTNRIGIILFCNFLFHIRVTTFTSWLDLNYSGFSRSQSCNLFNNMNYNQGRQLNKIISMAQYCKSFLIDEVSINFELGGKLKCTDNNSWIMFTVGSVDRCIGRRSGRHSVDSRSIVGRYVCRPI